jgi:protein phosphatase
MELKIYPPLAIHELGARDNQEDFIYPVKGLATVDDRLFIVCDGMGGHEKGEVASETFASALAEYFRRNVPADRYMQDAWLNDAIAFAYSKLDAKDDGNYKKMGTTLTLLYFHKGGVMAAHIGDSRIYHMRPGKRILYISRDHSLVYDLYQSGEISFGEIKTSQQKNVITRAVQPGEDNRVKPDVIHITDIKAGDYFYMCSDGMLEEMDDEELFSLLSGRGSDEKKLNKLIAATSGNQDNHSAYLIRIEDVKKDAADERNMVNEEETARCNALNMKQVKNVEIDMDDDTEEEDDITRISQSPVKQKSSSSNNGKKSFAWIWWALLIAAIVAIAAWLTLYAWTGNSKHPAAKQTVEKTVEEALPVEPIAHPETHEAKSHNSSRAHVAAEAIKAHNRSVAAKRLEQANSDESAQAPASDDDND